MSDSNLNITVTTDSGQLQDLINKLNSGNISMGEYNKTVRTLRSESIAGSQSLKDLGDVTAQVSNQSRSLASQQNSLIGIMKQDRQERRLGMFAVMESMHAIDGLVGKQSILSSSITNGAQAVFGMKFALEAMGMAATAAWPVALIVGAWSVISGILSSEKKATEELDAELEKQYQLKVKLGMIDDSSNIAHARDKLNEAQAKLDQMKGDQPGSGLVYDFGNLGKGNLFGISDKDIADQQTLVLQLTDAYKILYDAQNKKIEKDKEETQQRKEEIQQLKDARAEAIAGSIMDDQMVAAAVRGVTDARSGKSTDVSKLFQNIGGVDVGSNPAGGFSTSQIELTDQKKIASYKDESNKMQLTFDKTHDKNVKETERTQQQAFQDIQGGVSALQGMMEMLHMNTNTFLGSVLEGLNKILMIVETIKSVSNAISAVSNLFGLIGLEKGGDVVPGGGSLQFAASGGTYGFGGLQNVIVGERGAELMQVGRNGVRVISNNNLQQMNQASQASRGSMQQFEVIPGEMTLKANGDLAVAVSLAQRKLNGRTA